MQIAGDHVKASHIKAHSRTTGATSPWPTRGGSRLPTPEPPCHPYPVSVAVTAMRSPGLMLSTLTFAFPRKILVFSFKTIADVVPSVAFTSR